MVVRSGTSIARHGAELRRVLLELDHKAEVGHSDASARLDELDRLCDGVPARGDEVRGDDAGAAASALGAVHEHARVRARRERLLDECRRALEVREQVRKRHVRDGHLHRLRKEVIREVNASVHNRHNVRNPKGDQRRAALRAAKVAEVQAGYDLCSLRRELLALNREERSGGSEGKRGLGLELGRIAREQEQGGGAHMQHIGVF